MDNQLQKAELFLKLYNRDDLLSQCQELKCNDHYFFMNFTCNGYDNMFYHINRNHSFEPDNKAFINSYASLIHIPKTELSQVSQRSFSHFSSFKKSSEATEDSIQNFLNTVLPNKEDQDKFLMNVLRKFFNDSDNAWNFPRTPPASIKKFIENMLGYFGTEKIIEDKITNFSSYSKFNLENGVYLLELMIKKSKTPEEKQLISDYIMDNFDNLSKVYPKNSKKLLSFEKVLNKYNIPIDLETNKDDIPTFIEKKHEARCFSLHNDVVMKFNYDKSNGTPVFHSLVRTIIPESTIANDMLFIFGENKDELDSKEEFLFFSLNHVFNSLKNIPPDERRKNMLEFAKKDSVFYRSLQAELELKKNVQVAQKTKAFKI